MTTRLRIVFLCSLLLSVTGGTTVWAADAAAVMPTYDEDGKLLLPEDFREWVFAGSSLGLSYSEGSGGVEMFHHTLIEPTAFDHFVETGEFREGTMLALLLHDLGFGVLPGRKGQFANDLRAVELAVKDSERLSEGWGYYNFGSRKGLLDRAQPFGKESCHSCHVEHAAYDNVFLQFYPLLAQATTVPLPELSIQAPAAAAKPAPASSESRLVLAGLDPVLLLEGREEEGKPEIVAVRKGLRYQFVSEPSRAKFAADSERYSVRNDSCLVVQGAPNNPELWAVHDGKIYLFATPGCVHQFEADPESYLPSDG